MNGATVRLPTATPRLTWEREIPDGAFRSPVIVRDHFVVACQEPPAWTTESRTALRAFGTAEGVPVWTVDHPRLVSVSSPRRAPGGHVRLAAVDLLHNATLLDVDVDTGIATANPLPGEWGSLELHLTGDMRRCLLEDARGRDARSWCCDLDRPRDAVWIRSASIGAAHGNTVVVHDAGDPDGLTGVRVSDGAEVWRVSHKRILSVHESGVLFLERGAQKFTVGVLELETGRTRWTVERRWAPRVVQHFGSVVLLVERPEGSSTWELVRVDDEGHVLEMFLDAEPWSSVPKTAAPAVVALDRTNALWQSGEDVWCSVMADPAAILWRMRMPLLPHERYRVLADEAGRLYTVGSAPRGPLRVRGFAS